MPRYLNGSELNHVEIGLSACHISKMQVMNTIELSGVVWPLPSAQLVGAQRGKTASEKNRKNK